MYSLCVSRLVCNMQYSRGDYKKILGHRWFCSATENTFQSQLETDVLEFRIYIVLTTCDRCTEKPYSFELFEIHVLGTSTLVVTIRI